MTFVASENVVVCTPCYTAVPVTDLDTHLRTCHYVPFKLRRATIARFDGVPAAQSFNDLVPRQDGSTPLSYLSPPLPGFRCPHCTEGKTINWDQMRRHAKTNHNISAPECFQDQSRYNCHLQSELTCFLGLSFVALLPIQASIVGAMPDVNCRRDNVRELLTRYGLLKNEPKPVIICCPCKFSPGDSSNTFVNHLAEKHNASKSTTKEPRS